MSFLSTLISGISLGSMYALIALGYTMVYGIAKMLNFAHGEVIMIGGIATYEILAVMGMNAYVAIAVAVVVCTVLGVVVEKIAYKPLRKAGSLAVLITAIGVSYFLQNIALLTFGSAYKSYTIQELKFSWDITSNFSIQGTTIINITLTVVIMVALTLFIRFTKTGRSMLAVSEDRDAAQLMGINVNGVISVTFAIGSALACLLYTSLLTYQVAEIEQAELSEGEEEQLRQRKKILANAEKITENLGALHQLLQTSEGSAYDILARADRFFAELSECSAEFESLYHQFVDAYENLKDVTEEIADKYDRFEYDDRELDEIEERLDLIRSLKRKYGDTFEQIQTYLQQAQKELNSIQHADEQIQALVKEQDAALEQLQQKADRLTRSRQEAAEILQKKIVDNLAFLEMPNVRFHVSIRSCDPKNDGVDQVEFLLSPNLGEALKPLSEIASGGELSRIMLSIQNVLADTDHTETLIFDEIDTGVSGRAAQKIGIKLGQMAQVCQVITITHLAQIACYADRHYLIRKNHDEHRTYTEVVLLNHAQRIQELARILGGIHITPSVLSAAEEMLKQKTE